MSKTSFSILIFLVLIIPAVSFAGWGPVFPVNLWDDPLSNTDQNQWVFQGDPDVAMRFNGDFVVVWCGKQNDGAGDIFLRRFHDNGFGIVSEIDNTEFQVNTPGNSYSQELPTVAINQTTGEFVVVWQSATSLNPTAPRCQVWAHRFAWTTPNPTSLGQFLVADVSTTNPPLNYNNIRPVAAWNPANDNFIVSWARNNGTEAAGGADYDVMYKVYDNVNTGGAEYVANNTTAGTQWKPSISLDSSGKFVLAWESPDADEEGIYKRAFQANWATYDATALEGSDILVNVNWTTSHQLEPDVALNWQYGNYVITWHSNGNADGQASGIFAQLFNADNSFNGINFQVNQVWQNSQRNPEVDIDIPTSNFVITWDSDQQDGNGYGIVARRFYSTGQPIENEFLVNGTWSGTTDGTDNAWNEQQKPAIAMDAYCHFVIVWESYQWYNKYPNYDNRDVYGRMMYCNDDNAIELQSFSANSFGNSVVLAWETGTELDTLGFYLVRSDSLIGNFELITSDIIQSTGTSYSGGNYTFIDNSVSKGTVYNYWLVVLDTNGQYTVHGPASVFTNIGSIR